MEISDIAIINCSYDWWISNKSTFRSKPSSLVTKTSNNIKLLTLDASFIPRSLTAGSLKSCVFWNEFPSTIILIYVSMELVATIYSLDEGKGERFPLKMSIFLASLRLTKIHNTTWCQISEASYSNFNVTLIFMPSSSYVCNKNLVHSTSPPWTLHARIIQYSLSV